MNKASSANEPTQPGAEMAFQAQPLKQDLLRVMVCGTATDGKNPLVKHWLRESLPQSDQEQRACVDVAYHCFSSQQRTFAVLDTSGHERYTQDTLTDVSKADVAVLLVDAYQGLLPHTCGQAHLASLLGIQHLVLAVDDRDQRGFDAKVFANISETFAQFARPLGLTDIRAIPLSSLTGDNITRRSSHTPWYGGPTLMAYLEAIHAPPPSGRTLIFPVQQINQQAGALNGYLCTVAQGCVRTGDEVRATASGQTAKVLEMATPNGSQTKAVAGDVVTLELDKAINASHEDILSLAQHPLDTSDQFEATLIWLADETGHAGRSYDIKLANQWTTASITHFKHRVDTHTLAPEACTQLQPNDISLCNLATTKQLVFDGYKNSKTLGSFLLVDKFSRATVAMGLIKHSLRRAQNVHRQAVSITRLEREKLNGHRGQVIWFTGLSGSGKSTLANALEITLHAQGKRTYLLDGDNVRQGLNKDLGFTDADRVENIRRVAEVAKLMMDAGMIVMTAFISPFRQEREMARALIGADNFVEVYVNTPLEVCEQRDVKGLYKKARNGQLPNMSGISSPYEPPLAPQVIVNSHLSTIEGSVNDLVRVLSLKHPEL